MLGYVFTRKNFFFFLKSNTFMRFFSFLSLSHAPLSPSTPSSQNVSFISILPHKWRMQLLSKPLKSSLVLKLQLSLVTVWSQGFSFCPKLIVGLVTHLCSCFHSEHSKYKENHRQVSTSSIKKKKLSIANQDSERDKNQT